MRKVYKTKVRVKMGKTKKFRKRKNHKSSYLRKQKSLTIVLFVWSKALKIVLLMINRILADICL